MGKEKSLQSKVVKKKVDKRRRKRERIYYD